MTNQLLLLLYSAGEEQVESGIKVLWSRWEKWSQVYWYYGTGKEQVESDIVGD